ncbi:MAG: 2,3-bisphosphoglycerate-independent phosphoglycerate mutase [Thermoplasmata archaeon]|nr:2,3-bisphosphoglycerate-independent phosphoglycerate mutase [Thermoplasmata archaeon]
MSGQRFALIVLDGLGDRPAPGIATPLAAAATPHLDRMAKEGRTGLLSILGPGVAPESDAGVLALLGYSPVDDSPGRGVLEALGAEIPLAPGDVALRTNFATVDGSGLVVDQRVGRNLSTSEGSRLAAAVTAAQLLAEEGIQAELRSTVGHRGVLWLHPTDGGSLSAQVSNSDPFYDRRGGLGQARTVDRPEPRTVLALDPDPASERTAEALNRFLERVPAVLAREEVNARRALAGKRIANAVLLRNAGSLPRTPPTSFSERYGMEGAAVTEMPVERGIARLFGLEDRFVGPMGADRAASLRERAQQTRRALSERAFVYVHLKGPDEPGHDGDGPRKREMIEAIDADFIGPFLEGLASGVRVAVTADHATPVVVHGHSDDPVPVLLWDSGVRPAGPAGKAFSEEECARGALGTRSARELLPLLLAPTSFG